MHFGNPIALWLLGLLPVMALLGMMAQKRRRRALERMGAPGLVAQLFPESVLSWRTNRILLGLIVLGLFAFSAARPQYGRIEQVIRRAGVDVLIALDTSPSMMAQDVKPNRLQKARESLKWLLRRLKGNRVGIIAFAGDAFLNCPMTLDLSLADLVLESLDTKSVGVAGTDLGRAIRVAKGAFERGGSGRPVLVLITDGEDNEGQGLAAAKEAAEAGIQIFAIAVGTEGGAPVPEEGKGYKEADGGTKVNSKMDLAGLTALAKATGGLAYAAGGSPATAVEAIARSIARMEKTDMESKKIVIYQDRFAWFLAPGLLGLLWLMLSRPERHPKPAPLNKEAGSVSHAS